MTMLECAREHFNNLTFRRQLRQARRSGQLADAEIAFLASGKINLSQVARKQFDQMRRNGLFRGHGA